MQIFDKFHRSIFPTRTLKECTFNLHRVDKVNHIIRKEMTSLRKSIRIYIYIYKTRYHVNKMRTGTKKSRSSVRADIIRTVLGSALSPTTNGPRLY